LEIGVVHPIPKDDEFVEENQNGMVINRTKNGLQREEVLRQEMVNLLPRLRGFARSLAKEPDQADDLVQAACERALDRLYQVVEGARLDSWLYRIIYTQWIDKLRRGKFRSAKLVVLGADNETVSADSETGNRMADILDTQKALDILPAEHRAAITLVCVEGYSYVEAASVLDVPVGTVASRVARARIMLDRFLAHGRRHGSQLQRLKNIRAKGE
jgi:RNA polymerase sigma-70 factor (ECF subfamily)